MAEKSAVVCSVVDITGALMSTAVCIDVEVVDSSILDADLNDWFPAIGECMAEGPPKIWLGSE